MQTLVLDLFSGAGGLSLGFKWAGFRIACAIDNMKESCDTFKNNHAETLVINDDIRTDAFLYWRKQQQEKGLKMPKIFVLRNRLQEQQAKLLAEVSP